MTRPKFDPTITAGNILTVVVILAGGLVFGIRLESAVQINANDIAHNSNNDEKRDRRFSKAMENLQRDIDRVLDALAERPPSRPRPY